MFSRSLSRFIAPLRLFQVLQIPCNLEGADVDCRCKGKGGPTLAPWTLNPEHMHAVGGGGRTRLRSYLVLHRVVFSCDHASEVPP